MHVFNKIYRTAISLLARNMQMLRMARIKVKAVDLGDPQTQKIAQM